jgi:hypothetical protein
MAYGQTAPRGGAYNRLAETAWANPLDISFSAAAGGRWNQAGSYGVLYLNSSVDMARAQAEHKLAGMPYGPEDLDPAEQHDLVEVDVPAGEYLDCVNDPGLAAVGLPVSYPRHPDGTDVAHSECWPVGAAARADGQPGAACRSAAAGAPAGDEELAVFDTHAGGVTQTGRRVFADWWYAP